MGAWGSGTLENDAAMDLLGGIAVDGQSDGDLAAVGDVLREAAGTDGAEYLDADAGSDALAAAEIVAAAAGAPAAGADPAAREHLVAIADRTPELASLTPAALQAVDRVSAQESELRDLWIEADALDDWLAAVEDLRGRLKSGGQ